MVLAWLCLGSMRAVLPVLIIAGVGQLLAVAIVTAFGSEFSAVLIVLPTLVFMLTLSAAVHFMHYYSDVARSDSEYLGSRAVFLGLKPSVIATLTTALGMIALAATVQHSNRKTILPRCRVGSIRPGRPSERGLNPTLP